MMKLLGEQVKEKNAPLSNCTSLILAEEGIIRKGRKFDYRVQNCSTKYFFADNDKNKSIITKLQCWYRCVISLP